MATFLEDKNYIKWLNAKESIWIAIYLLRKIFNKTITHRKSRPTKLKREFYYMFKEEIIPILYKCFKKMENKWTFPTHHLRQVFPHIFLGKNITRKLWTDAIHKHLLAKINALANQTQQHIKEAAHKEKVIFIPGIHVSFNIQSQSR